MKTATVPSRQARHLLEVAPVLHGQAEDPRHRRPGRTLPPQVRPQLSRCTTVYATPRHRVAGFVVVGLPIPRRYANDRSIVHHQVHPAVVRTGRHLRHQLFLKADGDSQRLHVDRCAVVNPPPCPSRRPRASNASPGTTTRSTSKRNRRRVRRRLEDPRRAMGDWHETLTVPLPHNHRPIELFLRCILHQEAQIDFVWQGVVDGYRFRPRPFRQGVYVDR